MDRKSIKSDNRNRNRDGRRRQRPLNRYELEKSVDFVSTSVKKLRSSETFDFSINQTIGYRIINFYSVFLALAEHVKCKFCGGNVEFEESSKRGLGFKITIKCPSCAPKLINSCPNINNAYEINTRFIFAMRLIGIGWKGAEKFCAFMDLPHPIFQSTYDTIVKNICDAVKLVCDKILNSSVNEELEKTEEENQSATSTTNSRYNLIVSGDGSWRKRGFSSLFGVFSLIGYYSNKVVDVVVKSNFCKACSNMKKYEGTNEYNIWFESHQNNCQINHTGTAGKMEVDGIVEMFNRSENVHDVKYKYYIGDGDSKTYKNIVDADPYEETKVVKKECVNHVSKRMGSRLRKCKKNNKGLGGKGKLTDKVINDMSLYYSLAIRRNKDSVNGMHNAIWAILLHKSSTDTNPQHQNCPEGVDSWCTWQKAKAEDKLQEYKHKPALPHNVIEAITPIFKDLTDKELLTRCLGAYTQNNNESYNNLIWKIATKVLHSGVFIVEIAARLAVCIFNAGHLSLLQIVELLGIRIGPEMANYVENEDRRRITVAEMRTRAATHEERMQFRKDMNAINDAADATDDSFYGPGIDSLW